MSLLSRIRTFSNSHPLIKPWKYKIAHTYHQMVLKEVLKGSHITLYQVLGMKRSGNHAIINWILNGLPGLCSFCNDLSLESIPADAPIKKSRLGGLAHTHLICSYEDLYTEEVFSRSPVIDNIGQSIPILILRDPYNWAASWLAWDTAWGKSFRENKAYRNRIIAHWINHAEAYLALEKNSASKIGINYNQWVVSASYREDLANRLGMKKSLETIPSVSALGNGSSFDGMKFEQNPLKMKVLERWKNFSEDLIFEEIKRNSEVRRLSEKIFGDVLS